MLNVLVVSFLVSAFGVYLAWHVAIRMQLMDHPNERSFHDVPTPRIGGLGILLGVAPAILGALPGNGLWLWSIAMAVGAISLFDDWIDLPRWFRFAVHGLAGISILWWYDSWYHSGLPFVGEISPVIMGSLILFWLAGFINAYNFMDGIDGIAGWMGVVAGTAWYFFFKDMGQMSSAYLFLGVAAACGGFLVWNRPSARIFMGDTGSTFLGCIFAGAPLLAIASGASGENAFTAGVLFVWPFVIDTAQTLAYRAFKRERIFQAHRSHIFQRLAATWKLRRNGHWVVGLLYAGLAILGMGLHHSEGPLFAKFAIIGGIWVAVVGWTILREMEHAS